MKLTAQVRKVSMPSFRDLYRRFCQFIVGDKKPGLKPEHLKSKSDIEDGEPIRLVIWDLDETFWNGTLTEGGTTYLQDHHDAVIALARRGIMSSICSRNDYDTIKRLMIEHDIWQYFVFASIDWTSKGSRLKTLVEKSQLRAATVLFIDDNPMNRAEAKRFVDGLRVSDPAAMGDLLQNPLLKGKDDPGLTRLAQYQLLERRSQDMQVAESSNAFLYESDIRVVIDHDIESNLDRAIELINRTNQLNFTKRRLSEDTDLARQELLELLQKMEIQAGLVRVIDRYGDYGYCGIYVRRRWMHEPNPILIHFCFSCRTLGMEIETWLYRKLGRPELDVKGEVLTDVKNSRSPADWITLVTSDALIGGADLSSIRKSSNIMIRGGCEVVAISHYFEVLTDNLVLEFAFQREGLDLRLDHTQMLKLAYQSSSPKVMESLLALGFHKSDFDTAFPIDSSNTDCIYIWGMWSEPLETVFRHTRLDFKTLVFWDRKVGVHARDILSLNPESLPAELQNDWVSDALRELKNNYEYIGRLPAEDTKNNILQSVQSMPPNSLVFLMGGTEKILNYNGDLETYQPNIDLNLILKGCADNFKQVRFISIDKHIELADRHGSLNHYSRNVYFRLFIDIKNRIDEWHTAREGVSMH